MARYASLVWAVPTALAVLVLAKGVLQSGVDNSPTEQRVAPAIVERLPSQGRLRAPDDEQPAVAGAPATGLRVWPVSVKKSPPLKQLAVEAGAARSAAARPAVPRREPVARPEEPAEILYPITSAADIPSLPDAWSPIPRGTQVRPHSARTPSDAQASQAIARPMSGPRAGGRTPDPVRQQLATMNHKALRLAERGALYSARAELLEALRLVAQAQDAQSGGASCASALDAALAALEEADDFSSPRGAKAAHVSLADVIRPHRTPVLKRVDASRLSGLAASQHYLAYAQQQLALAAGSEPAAAQSLYLLGKVHTHLAGESASIAPAHTAHAMVFHQAALAIDPQHYQAANELGVLLARFGELTAARKMLLTSVKSNATPSAWHNLAAVHERLGETDLAKRARYEAELLAGKSQRPASGHSVQWVDAATFAAQSTPAGGDATSGNASVAAAAVPATSRPQAQRR